MRKIYYIFCLSLITQIAFSQSVNRCYRVLERQDYEKAKELFESLLEENKTNPAANFGLVVVHATPESPFFDIVQAMEHATVTEENLNHLNQDDSEIIKEYFMNTQERPTSRKVQKKITMALEDVEANLIKYVREENNLELVQQVIEKFPDFKHYDNVVHIRNHLEFRKAEKTNTIEAYNKFLQTYPKAAQVSKAIDQRNALAYEQAHKKNTLQAMQQFIDEYPEAEEVNKAIMRRNKLAFEKAKSQNTLEALQTFIEKYPEALEVSDARKIKKRLVYEKAKKIRTLEAYNEFIKQYPEGEMYIDIFNLKAEDLGEKYLGDHLGVSSSVAFARVFDNDEKTDHTGALTINSNNEIVLVGNTRQADTSDFTDPWVLGLDQDGKMLWNKIIGYPYSDKVNDVEVNANNDIYCSGITNRVNDSIPGEAWLFKLDPDGKKLWNRTLGLKSTVGFEINDEDMLIILGDYIESDTVEKHYVLKIDGNGTKRWKRTYVDPFEAKDINISAIQDMIIVTDRWVYGLDQAGYLVWETRYDTSFTAVKGAVDATGQQYYVAGMNDENEIILTCYTRQGKEVWERNLGKTKIPEIYDLELVGENLLLAASFEDNNELVLLDKEGRKSRSWDLLGNEHKEVVHIAPNKNNAAITTANGNVILLKMDSVYP